MLTPNRLMRIAHSKRVIGFDGCENDPNYKYRHGDVKKSLS